MRQYKMIKNRLRLWIMFDLWIQRPHLCTWSHSACLMSHISHLHVKIQILAKYLSETWIYTINLWIYLHGVGLLWNYLRNRNDAQAQEKLVKYLEYGYTIVWAQVPQWLIFRVQDLFQEMVNMSLDEEDSSNIGDIKVP